MPAVLRCFLFIALLVAMTLPTTADDKPASAKSSSTKPTREELQSAAEDANAAKAAAKTQLAAARQTVQKVQGELLEARRMVKQAEQELQAAEGRLAAEEEAVQKSQEAKQASLAARQAAEQALDKTKAAVKKDLNEAQAESADAAVAEAQKQVDAATKSAEETMAAADAARKTLQATEKSIADSRTNITSGRKLVSATESKLKHARQLVTTSAEQLARATTEWVTKQQRLERVLRTAGEWVSFTDEIAPLFHTHCIACHNTRTAKGRLNLSTFAALMKGGESGAAVDPGDGEFSNLCLLIEDGSMPKDADPLSETQIARVKRWVELGAKLDAGADPNLELIRIMPRPEQPPAPDTYRLAIPVTALAFSPDGANLATSGYHEVLIWKVADGSLVRRIGNMAERIYDLEFHSSGKQLAVAAGTPGQLGEVRIVNPADGSLLRDFVTVGDAVFAATFSPDGKRLATAGADRAIRIFDVETGAEQTLIEDHADWVMSACWSPDGSQIASASRDKTAKLFDANSGDALVTFNGHGDVVFGIGFLPDGEQVATTGADNRIRVWTVEKAEQKQEIKSHGGDVFQIQVLPDGKAVTCSEDKTARIFNLADGKQLHALSGHNDWVYAACAHADTQRIATGSYDGEVRLWNLDDGKPILTFRAAPGLEQVSIEAKK